MKEEIVKEVMAKGGLDLVIDYTKKFIEAATPVAKQAYEIGLMTLQVDALATLIPALLLFVVWAVVTKYVWTAYRKAVEKEEASAYGDPDLVRFMYGVTYGGLSAVAWIFIGNVFSVWLWVKLFMPELWLAHEAIEKLVR